MAEPQWEIPLYVWLTILAISRSWSCFQSCTPQVRPRSAIFHPYKSETRSIPVFFLGVPPPPLPEYHSIIPDPVNICLAGISLRSWRYYVSARLKIWWRSRVPKKGSRDEVVDGSALKFHSTILQRLRRQISLDYYTIPPATQARQEFKCFSEEQELSQLTMGIDPWPWSGLLVRVLWIPVSRTKHNRTCL